MYWIKINCTGNREKLHFKFKILINFAFNLNFTCFELIKGKSRNIFGIQMSVSVVDFTHMCAICRG